MNKNDSGAEKSPCCCLKHMNTKKQHACIPTSRSRSWRAFSSRLQRRRRFRSMVSRLRDITHFLTNLTAFVLHSESRGQSSPRALVRASRTVVSSLVTSAAYNTTMTRNGRDKFVVQCVNIGGIPHSPDLLVLLQSTHRGNSKNKHICMS